MISIVIRAINSLESKHLETEASEGAPVRDTSTHLHIYIQTLPPTHNAMDHWAIIAGCFAIVSVAISSYEIIRHLSSFTKPYLQRYIIRILLMVPIYSLNAWIAMLLPSTGLYLDSMREVYESFVIYSFMKYLLNFLKYDTNLQQYIAHKPGPEHIFPFCCLARCVGGRPFIIRCKHGILQYVVVRPFTTLVAFISQQLCFYGEGNYNPLSGSVYPVLLLINNASQILAMYSLVIFYTGYRQELGPMRPLAKFFSIKLVVFFSFFQQVVISALLEVELIEETLRGLFPDLPDKVSLGRKVQEFLICFDMLIAALGHLFAFPHSPYEEPAYNRSGRLAITHDGPETGSRQRRRLYSTGDEPSRPALDDEDPNDRSCCSALCSILDFSEDKSDISEHLSEILKRIRQTFTFSPLPTIESAPIEPGQQVARTTPTTSISSRLTGPQPDQTGLQEGESFQSSGLGSTLAAPDLAGQSINSSVRNYRSIS